MAAVDCSKGKVLASSRIREKKEVLTKSRLGKLAAGELRLHQLMGSA